MKATTDRKHSRWEQIGRWLGILSCAALAACTTQPPPAGDHPDVSTEAFLGLQAERSEINVGEHTTVTVHMQNLPMFAYHMFSSPDEYFALVATSSDGGEVGMLSNSYEDRDEVQLVWRDPVRGPHPTQDPTNTCEGPGGNVEQESECAYVCCVDEQGSPTELTLAGSCPEMNLSLPHVDECIFGLSREHFESVCCLEYDKALVCCDPHDELMSRDQCLVLGGFATPMTACTDYLFQLGQDEFSWAHRRVVLAKQDACVSTNDYLTVQLPAEDCLCCEKLDGDRDLSLAELCRAQEKEWPAEACFANSCSADEDRPYQMHSCKVACCELPGGSVVIEDRLVCTLEGGADLGFQSERCPLISVCCHQERDFEWVSGLQVGRGSSSVRVTGASAGTVTFKLRQVTSVTPPVLFRDFPSSGSEVTVKVTGNGGDCVPSFSDVGGDSANPVIWEEIYTCTDNAGNCFGEEDVEVALALTQTGKDIDWEIVEGFGKGSEFSGEMCDSSFEWTSKPQTPSEQGCWEFTANSFNKRSYGADFKCVGSGSRGAGSKPAPLPSCKDIAAANVDYSECPSPPPASPINGGSLQCDGQVIVMPTTNNVPCTPPDTSPCGGCDDYCLDNGFPMGSTSVSCEASFCQCGCTYCRPN